MKNDIDLSQLTFGEVKKKSYDLAILPWGATEPHNYHLPYLTDCYLAHDVSVDAALQVQRKCGVRCMILPPIPLGSQNPGQWNQPFCLHARYETQKAILTDIVVSLYRQGVRKLVIVNGHGGNSFKNMIRDLAFDYPDFTVAIANWYDIIPQSDYFDQRDDHAGEMETSVLMHYRPGMIDLKTAGDGSNTPFALSSLNEKTAWIPRNWEKVSEDTGVGNPLLSTAEKGKQYAEVVTGKLAQLFEELATKELYS